MPATLPSRFLPVLLLLAAVAPAVRAEPAFTPTPLERAAAMEPRLPQPASSETYREVGGVSLNVHVFPPTGAVVAEDRPALLLFHGGGWKDGQPAHLARYSAYFAARGMVCFGVEYRLEKAHGTTPFESVEDAFAALRWVRAHAQEYGVDPERIAILGASAGGHLALATCLMPELDDSDAPAVQPPDALLLLNPVLDTGPEGYGHDQLKDRYLELSPIDHLDRALPPFMIQVGTDDRFVPMKTVDRFMEQAAAAGTRGHLKTYDGLPHGFFNLRNDRSNAELFQRTLRAFDRFLAGLSWLEPQ